MGDGPLSESTLHSLHLELNRLLVLFLMDFSSSLDTQLNLHQLDFLSHATFESIPLLPPIRCHSALFTWTAFR